MPFTVEETLLPGVFHITSKTFQDDRGMFAELFQLSALQEAGITKSLTQSNWSKSKKNVLRGLHYQNAPKAQAKLVMCTAGEVFDVAVDIRKGSPTFGKWVGETLTADAKNALFIPHGFAHGFCALTDDAEVVYFCDEEYSPEQEGGIVWNDPAIGIEWPIVEPILAERDAAFPNLADANNKFTY